MEIELQDVKDFIAFKEMTYDEGVALNQLLVQRLKNIRLMDRSVMASKLEEGTTVRIKNIRPKKLVGITGTVVIDYKRHACVSVKVDHHSAMMYGYAEDYVITGIPVTCLEIISRIPTLPIRTKKGA